MVYNEWFKAKYFVYRYKREFKERLDTYSKVEVNGKVAMVFFNLRTEAPIQDSETRKAVGRELKHLFKAGRYLCIVAPSQKSRVGKYYTSHIEFYFITNGLPENVEQVPRVIEDNLIFPKEDAVF